MRVEQRALSLLKPTSVNRFIPFILVRPIADTRLMLTKPYAGCIALNASNNFTAFVSEVSLRRVPPGWSRREDKGRPYSRT